MKPGRGKQKGNSFERYLCRELSLWYSEGQANDWCWRSASSGARGTTSRTKTKGYHGDITATAPEMELFFKYFSIEAKSYRALDVTEVLRSYRFTKYPQIIGFWRQALKSAVLSGRNPLLIYKTNNMPPIVVCKKVLAQRFQGDDIFTKKIPYIILGNKLVLADFASVLTAINADSFKIWLKREAAVV